jgi:hypothetical protein
LATGEVAISKFVETRHALSVAISNVVRDRACPVSTEKNKINDL